MTNGQRKIVEDIATLLQEAERIRIALERGVKALEHIVDDEDKELVILKKIAAKLEVPY